MKTYELPAETKAATGLTHKAIVTHVDLTEATADNDQTIALLSVVAVDVVEKAAYTVKPQSYRELRTTKHWKELSKS
jgi:hypothetical protein